MLQVLEKQDDKTEGINDITDTGDNADCQDEEMFLTASNQADRNDKSIDDNLEWKDSVERDEVLEGDRRHILETDYQINDTDKVSEANFYHF